SGRIPQVGEGPFRLTRRDGLKSAPSVTDAQKRGIAVRGAPVMRWSIVIVCLFSLILSGCATRQPTFVPPGDDRDQLVASIARRGQDTSSDESVPEALPARQQTRLDRSVQWVLEATPVALTCVAVAPLLVLYALAKGPHGPIDFSKLGSSS